MNAITHAHRMSHRTANMTLTSRGIRIGIATVPRQRIEVTQDAVRVQRAILAKPRNPDWYVGLTIAGCGLAVAVMAIFGWLPGAGV